MGIGEVHARLWWKNLTERDHFSDLRVDERIILKHIFKK
jgi:hypothetical protein